MSRKVGQQRQDHGWYGQEQSLPALIQILRCGKRRNDNKCRKKKIRVNREVKEKNPEHSKQRSDGETCTNPSIRKEKCQGMKQWK